MRLLDLIILVLIFSCSSVSNIAVAESRDWHLNIVVDQDAEVGYEHAWEVVKILSDQTQGQLGIKVLLRSYQRAGKLGGLSELEDFCTENFLLGNGHFCVGLDSSVDGALGWAYRGCFTPRVSILAAQRGYPERTARILLHELLHQVGALHKPAESYGPNVMGHGGWNELNILPETVQEYAECVWNREAFSRGAQLIEIKIKLRKRRRRLQRAKRDGDSRAAYRIYKSILKLRAKRRELKGV